MERLQKLDKWGYEVNTCSDDCVSAINEYYHQLLSYGRKRSVILEATKHDKDCVLANILAAHFLISCDPSQASQHLQAATARLDKATAYEKAVFDTVKYLISEDMDDDVAVDMHSKLLKDFPRDLASLKRAQVLCFYMGRADLSLDLVLQVLPQNKQENYIYGMLAFAFLEVGRMGDAEKAAKKGFDINKEDCWSQHALCHIYQYECRFKEAVNFMEECSRSWDSCSSFMYTHNWWHVALCYLEGHSSLGKVREIYDQHIWKELERPDSVPAEVLLNAVGLLLRVHVRGKIELFGDRLQILAGYLKNQRCWYLEWHSDILIIWALASTGETFRAEELLNGLESRLLKTSKKKQQLMQRGLLLAKVLYEYGRGNNKKALELLGPDFDVNEYKIIGASDEQLDVFNEVWYSMLLDTEEVEKAIEVLEREIKKREGLPFLWHLLARSYKLAGRKDAPVAEKKARALENAYFK